MSELPFADGSAEKSSSWNKEAEKRLPSLSLVRMLGWRILAVALARSSVRIFRAVFAAL